LATPQQGGWLARPPRAGP